MSIDPVDAADPTLSEHPLPTSALPAGDLAQIRADALTVVRGGRTLFTDLSVTVSARSRLAIVGENGRGKTTLLHLLAGAGGVDHAPDHGTVRRVGTVALTRQAMRIGAEETVGTLVDEALSSSRAAIAALDRATVALTQGVPGSDDAYADALDAATRLDAWTRTAGSTSHWRPSTRAPTATGGWPRCRSASATASVSPACWGGATTSGSSTSRPTTLTPTVSTT